MLKVRRNRVSPPPEECSLTLCMRFISGAWTANILWYLGDHARRFSELKQDLRGVSAKMLAQRLRRLEADGLVVRRAVDSSPPSVEYELSPLGRTLQPALTMLVDVGHRLKQQRTTNEKLEATKAVTAETL